MQSGIIPTSSDEMKALGWDQADIILVSGDAYVDHPSFGTAVMARLAEKAGLKVAVLPQPNWRDDLRDFKKLGKPKYFFGVTAGCMDSMVNHYTARKRLRSNDAYSPGGRAGFRPDYASVVYSRILKELYPNTPIILGGIEASLRRLTHYDYWSNNLKPSILIESKADCILYGMAERSFLQLIDGFKFANIGHIAEELPQSVYICKKEDLLPDTIMLPSHEDCLKSKKEFARSFRITEENANQITQKPLAQLYGDKYVVVTPSLPPPDEEETDMSFDLPYSRKPHPRYAKKPPIPAFEMIKDSVTVHRGCFGGCAFCAINAHQGKHISSRSQESILQELKLIASAEDFKGHITDLGGPSANMYKMKGIDKKKCIFCKRSSCIYPSICDNLCYDHKPLIDLYRKARSIYGIKNITIGSGIRYDMLVGQPQEKDSAYSLSNYATLLIEHHVSGRLKVAPEHIADNVLKLMRKPSFEKFRSFHRLFAKTNSRLGKKQELVLYLIAGHPESREEDMKLLANTTKAMGYRVETVQEFTPTPMTLSSVMYYTRINPYTGNPVYVPGDITSLRKQKNSVVKESRTHKKRKQ